MLPEVSYSPSEEASQSVIDDAFKPTPSTFWRMFSGGHDLSTSKGQDYRLYGGLSGAAAASALEDPEYQKELYIQSTAVEYGLLELNNVVEAFEKIGAERNFSADEADQFEAVLERKAALEADLAFVKDNFEGNRDTAMFDNGNTFNDVWANDPGETAGISELLDFAVDNPTGMLGLLAGEVVIDAPLSVLAFLGVGAKLGKGVSIIDRVHRIHNKIQPKALKGLARPGAYMATGVGASAAAGAGYEAAYTELTEGQVDTDRVKAGAEFGAIFGILAGLGLASQGSKLQKGATALEAGVGTVADSARQASKVDSSTLSNSQDNLAKLQKMADEMVSKVERGRIKEDADNLDILPDSNYNQKVVASKGHADGEVIYSVPDAKTGEIATYLDRAAAKREWLRIKREVEESGGLNGTSIKQLTPRQLATLKNYDSYEAMLLAKEKVKGALILDHINENGSVQGLSPNIDNEANIIAKAELDRIDAARLQKKPDNPSDTHADEVVAEEGLPVTKPEGFLYDALEKSPNATAAGIGAVGYGLAEYGSDNEGIYGLIGGAALSKIGGPKLLSVLNKTTNMSVLKTKRDFAEQTGDYTALAKVTELQMANVLERVHQVFVTPKAKEDLIEAIENPNFKLESELQRSVKNEVKLMLHIIGREAVDAGIIRQAKDVGRIKFGKFEKNKQGSYLYNYFPHLFRKEVTEEFLEELVTKYGTTTLPSGNRRTMMATIKQIDNDYPDMNIITDPLIALETYTKAMTKAVYGRRMIDSLRRYDLEFDAGRVPAMMTKSDFDALSTGKAELISKKDKGSKGLTTEEAAHYEYFTHPSLKGYVAHNNVKNLIDGHFKTLRKGGARDLAESALKFGNGLKRIAVFGSLFHAQSLILSFSYVMGVTGAIKGLGGAKFKGRVGKNLKVQQPDGTMVDLDWSHLKLGTGMYQGIVEEAVSWKLGVGDTKSRHLLNEGKEEMDNFLARYLGEGSLPGKAFEAIDHITWDQLHDRFKVAAWLQQRQTLMERGVSFERASEKAAIFVNDGFGSLDWEGFATRLYDYALKHPNSLRGKIAPHIAAAMPSNNRKWFNALLFAPDWTVSNIRIVGNTVPLTARTFKALKSEGFMKAFHKNPSMKSQEAKELLAVWKMYGAYTTRAGIQTTMLWWALAQANGWFSGPDSPEPDFAEFMKFWKTGKLDLGGGESMVISKQIMEPIHWVTNFRHTLMNKGAILPKKVYEGMMNKQWFTLKGDNPYGPAISDKDGSHYFKWLAKPFVPIVVGPALDDSIDWAERLERIASGAVGFPQFQGKK